MVHQNKSAVTGPALVGIGVSGIVMLLGCLLATWLIHRGAVDMEDIGYLVMGILFATGLAGGITAVTKGKEKLLIVGSVISAAVFVAILCIGFLFFDGVIYGVWPVFLLVVGANIASVLVGTHRKDRKKPRRRRMRTG